MNKKSHQKLLYFVEGPTEKKLIEEFKKAQAFVLPGHVNVLNVTQRRIPKAILTNLSKDTIIVLIFDTDIPSSQVLKDNVKSLKKSRIVKDVWCVPQVENLEDELIYATDVKEIKDLIGCRSNKDFKASWNKEKNLLQKLDKHGFNFSKFWSSTPRGVFSEIENCGHKIKQGKK